MRTTQVSICLLLSAALAPAAPHLGTAIARGEFHIDNASVRGNATVFEGSAIRTAAATSDIQLESGARIRLAPDSLGRFYRDRLVLERGAGQVEGAYGIEAHGLRVLPSSQARVVVGEKGRLQVAAVNGAVRVTTAAGLEVANVEPGEAVDLDTQAAADPLTRITGKLIKQDGRYFLTDEVSKVRFEITGERLEQFEGKRVQVTGSADAKLVRAISVELMKGKSTALIAGILVGSGAATAATIAITTRDKEPISR